MEKYKLPELSYTPLYQQIKIVLTEKIKEGSIAPGQYLPPERELSRAFGVNRQTVRRALSEMVDERLLIRKPGVGTMVSDFVKSTQVRIGVIMYGGISVVFENSFYGNIFSGIEKEITGRNGAIVFLGGDSNNFSETDAKISAEQINGLILIGIMEDEYINPFIKTDIPIVLIDYKLDSVDSVFVDDFGGAYEAVQYLIDMGHTDIAYIGGLRGSAKRGFRKEASSEERKKGYLQALNEAGIIQTYIAEEHLSTEGGEEAMTELLKKSPSISALLAFSDSMACGAIRAIHISGRSVPQDISVIGFGDSGGQLTTPPLTSVRIQAGSHMGSTAAQSLLKRIHGKNAADVRHIAIPTKLVIRESCAKKVNS